MTSRQSRENAAANAVVETLNFATDASVEGCTFDDGSQARMHDFTITSELRAIALEVSTIADGNRVGRDVRWGAATSEGWLSIPSLTGSWIAAHEGDVEADTAIAELHDHLPPLESLGSTWIETIKWEQHAFAPPSMRPPEWDHMRALNRAGFSTLTRVEEKSDSVLGGQGGIVYVGRGFEVDRPTDRNLPVALVTEELLGDHASDVRKLREAREVAERHLWLWVELTEGFALLDSFEAEGMPDVDINVWGIDGVWLARSPCAQTIAGYVWLRGRGWSAFSAARNEQALDPC